MNHLTPTQPSRPTALTVIPSFAEAPGALGAAIRAVRRGVNINPVSAEVRQEAHQHLEQIRPLCASATQGQMMAWLIKLAPGVVNAPVAVSEIEASAGAIWEDCSHLPCAVWCDETRITWRRKQIDGRHVGKFWPSSGELSVHLEEFATFLKADKAGCESILALASPQPEGEFIPPTGEVREAVKALMASFRAEVAERRESRSVSVDQPKQAAPVIRDLADTSLADEELLEVYEKGEREGHGPSVFRAKHLRAKLASRLAERGGDDADWR